VPRFYFDVKRDKITDLDKDGVHLPSVIVARAEPPARPWTWSKTAYPKTWPTWSSPWKMSAAQLCLRSKLLCGFGRT